jgi:ribonuclease-3
LKKAQSFSSKQLHYEFSDTALLRAALTHRSAGSRNNERLEFLGDGALNFVIASEIYHLRPDYSEGQLSRLRATLVRGTTLAEIARDIGVGDHLKLGTGELKSGGFKRSSILADAIEALIGAVYLDGGFNAAADLVRHLYRERLANLPPDDPQKDAKTRLQEYLQSRKIPIPDYTLTDTAGEAHQREFTVLCRVDSLSVEASASGSSRRRAEQAAASGVLEQLIGNTDAVTASNP